MNRQQYDKVTLQFCHGDHCYHDTIFVQEQEHGLQFSNEEEIQQKWSNDFQINQIRMKSLISNRSEKLKKLGFQPKTCWHCLERRDGHRWVDGRTRIVGERCTNGSKCGVCLKQVTWYDQHGPTIDCPKLPKTKSEILKRIKENSKSSKQRAK